MNMKDFLRKNDCIVKLQGKEFVTYSGLLMLAHSHGVKSIQSTLIHADHEGRFYAFRTVVEGERGTFTGYGDASPSNVSRNLANATMRFAETRANARALRCYLGIGMTAKEELPGNGGSGAPQQQGRGQQKTSSRADAIAEFEAWLNNATGLSLDDLDRWLVAHERKPTASMTEDALKRMSRWLNPEGDGNSANVHKWLSEQSGGAR